MRLNPRATGLIRPGCCWHQAEDVDIVETYIHTDDYFNTYRSTTGTRFGPLTQKQRLAVTRACWPNKATLRLSLGGEECGVSLSMLQFILQLQMLRVRWEHHTGSGAAYCQVRRSINTAFWSIKQYLSFSACSYITKADYIQFSNKCHNLRYLKKQIASILNAKWSQWVLLSECFAVISYCVSCTHSLIWTFLHMICSVVHSKLTRESWSCSYHFSPPAATCCCTVYPNWACLGPLMILWVFVSMLKQLLNP